ncbi:ABC transporter permease [Aneurinibacillus thermoaerophilus]|uniref:ABC transporter permease n=1 Tax=Aneurinibacillus thermoaerophilus TaxID=143495 RepID=UPI002E1A62D1|nr:ABC transporter permease [Aneurinibacillus thermoaerophilus]MED0766111.1 ABC transporter permease [Aneurinibacillus thermoaerophilus]
MKQLLAAEWLKMRRSGMIWIAVLVPLFLVVQGVGNFLRYRDTVFAGSTRTEWEILYEQCMFMYPTMLMPLVITVLIALLARVENVHGGWKQLLTFPVTRGQVYVAKLVIACMLVLLNMAVLSGGTLAGGWITGAEGQAPYGLLLGRGALAFVAALPIIAIQFVLSFRFSHIGIPLTLGVGFAAPAIFAANSEKLWIFYPWTYPITTFFAPSMERFDKGLLMYGIAVTLFVIIMTFGLREFKNRDMT